MRLAPDVMRAASNDKLSLFVIEGLHPSLDPRWASFACFPARCRVTLSSMLRLRWAFWSMMAALLVVAAGLGFVKFNATRAQTQAVPGPPGDQEIGWFHTATHTPPPPR